MKMFFAAASLATVAAFSAAALTAPAAHAQSYPWEAVAAYGQIIGQDPDPNVRLQLSREAQLNDGYYGAPGSDAY